MKRLKISFDVVTKGPVARAGSMFNLFKANGTATPIRPAVTMMIIKASAIIEPKP